MSSPGLQSVLDVLGELVSTLRTHHQAAEQWGPIMLHPAADPALDRDQAARYCGRHPKTLERAAKAGELPYLQTGEGGRIQYRLSALNAWLDKSSTKPPRRRTTQRPYDL